MPPDIRLHLVPDNRQGYHPYTVAYRDGRRDGDFPFGDPSEPATYRRHVEDRTWPGDRARLVETLHAGLAPFDPPEAVRANIERLREPHAWAVAAGHQPALFGGPLFLLWKILGVLRLAEALNRGGDAVFVPLFWNGSEDHNRAEFGRVTLFDREHDLLHLALPEDGKERMAAATPAAEARQIIDEMAKLLPDTEFLPDLLDTLRRAADRKDLGAMQTDLLLRWFGDAGLVVVEPHMLRASAAPVIAKALEENEAVHEAFHADTEAMRAMGFDPPLPEHERARTRVYYLADGARYRIRRAEDGYALERRDRSFPGETVFEELEAHPERFSPSAALRPVVQAATLPVAAYVAGGGELAYHVQLRSLFAHFDQSVPVLAPRPAGTILKRSCAKTAAKLEIPLDGLIGPGWDWESVEAEGSERSEAQDAAFASFRDELAEARKRLETRLGEAGIDNTNELTREADRFLDRLEQVRERYRAQDPRVGEGPRRQYWRLRKLALPGDRYQELAAWAVYFLALYGPELPAALRPSVDPFARGHHLFVVE